MSAHRSSLFAQRGGKGIEQQPPRNGSAHKSDREMETELQNENDAMLDSVSVDMTRLRAAARTLRDEAADHNRYLDTLEGLFGNARDGVKGSITRLDGVMARYGCKDTFSCAGILFVVLLVLYFLFKHVNFSSSTSATSAPSISEAPS
ncbi:transmembrane protein, putative [Bodo saltans]|uniref:Transmembrane protein, putative n=1 Tax=Bodo saltans TaxID=75058 RepID=A0A0S4IMR3_BODSA|nr:transmembrane protein, putative [Bodo saltans]|eukprot:CUE73962.1 transmembrane protein, putative [Bodo saltans]